MTIVNTKEQKVPRVFNFIALGPIPTPYLPNILGIAHICAKQNPPFRAVLHVKNQKETLQKLQKEYAHLDLEVKIDQKTNKFGNLEIKNISLITQKMQQDIKSDQNPDGFYEAKECKLLMDLIETDQIGFRNLASVSDVLRYELLRQEGGYYLDWDTHLVKGQLDDTKLIDEKGFKASVYGKKEGYSLEGGNSILASTKNHPILQETLKHICMFYEYYKEEELNKTKSHSFSLNDKKRSNVTQERKTLTMDLSGPNALITTLELNANIAKESYLRTKFGTETPRNIKVANLEVIDDSSGNWIHVSEKRSFDNEFRTSDPSPIISRATMETKIQKNTLE